VGVYAAGAGCGWQRFEKEGVLRRGVGSPPPLGIGWLDRVGEFFVGDEVHAENDVVVGAALHVQEVLGQAAELLKAELLECFDGDGALAVELGFKLLEAEVSGDIDDFAHEEFGDVASAVVGVG
jgi:hypothetical protein